MESPSPSVENYLREVAAGREDLPAWREFLNEHAAEFERVVGRAAFLRLKFQPSAEVPSLLDSLNIPYDRKALNRRLVLADRGVGWRWTPLDPLRVRRLYRSGRADEGDTRQLRAAMRLARSRDVERGQRLGEWVYDADALLDAGHGDEALGALRAVASLPRGDDLVDPAITDARDRLRALARAHFRDDADSGTPDEIVSRMRQARAATT